MSEPQARPSPEPDQGENPLAYELAEQLAADSPDGSWVYYVNDVFGNVFEYADQQRLIFWDKANFMGSIDGYAWELERWSPDRQRWDKVATQPGIYSRRELEHLLRVFTTAGSTGPHWVSQADAHAASRPTRADNRLTRLLQARAQALDAAPDSEPGKTAALDLTTGRDGVER